MQEVSITWDYRNMVAPISAGTKAFMLYLLVVCVASSVKLVKVWVPAAPFRLSARVNTPAYVELLNTSSASLKRWTALTLLLWGIFTSVGLRDVREGLLTTRTAGTSILLFVLQDMSTYLTMTLLVVLFSFLVRWHMLRRIEILRCIPN